MRAKAFIFDMDGVIVNSELTWRKQEEKFLPKLVGKEVFTKIEKDILGSTYYKIYEMAKENGSQVSLDDFYKVYDAKAKVIYQKSPLTKNIIRLIKLLSKNKIKIGLVSASRLSEIKEVLKKTSMERVFKVVISLEDRRDLRPKPFPDGYKEAMQKLKVKPKETIILEDSNKGIKAAKKSGALTLCLRENHSKDYNPKGADFYMNNVSEVIKFLNL